MSRFGNLDLEKVGVLENQQKMGFFSRFRSRFLARMWRPFQLRTLSTTDERLNYMERNGKELRRVRSCSDLQSNPIHGSQLLQKSQTEIDDMNVSLSHFGRAELGDYVIRRQLKSANPFTIRDQDSNVDKRRARHWASLPMISIPNSDSGQYCNQKSVDLARAKQIICANSVFDQVLKIGFSVEDTGPWLMTIKLSLTPKVAKT